MISGHCQSFYEILLIYMQKRYPGFNHSFQHNAGITCNEVRKYIQHPHLSCVLIMVLSCCYWQLLLE